MTSYSLERPPGKHSGTLSLSLSLPPLRLLSWLLAPVLSGLESSHDRPGQTFHMDLPGKGDLTMTLSSLFRALAAKLPLCVLFTYILNVLALVPSFMGHE